MKIRTRLVIISTTLHTLLILGVLTYIIFDTEHSYEELAHKRNLGYIEIIKESLAEHDSFRNKKIDSLLTEKLPYQVEKIYYQIYDSNSNLILEDGDIFDDPQYREHLLEKKPIEVFDNNEEAHYFITIKDAEVNGRNFTIAVAIRAHELEIEWYGIKLVYFSIFLLLIPIIAFFELYYSRLAFHPIKKIIQNVKQITSTNLSRRLEVHVPKDEIRELEETLNIMISRLEEAFDSQKRFIADASHEIKTPLTIIRAELELLKDHNKENSEQINRLLNEIDRLTELAKSLLLLAKLDARDAVINFDKIRIDEILMDVVKSFNFGIKEKKINFILNIDDISEINGDEFKIKSALSNLVDNAVKYSSEESTIKITLQNYDYKCCITIEDQGCGIPKDEVNNVFERFYRSNEHRASIQGSGLGLSIVQEIITLHKGTINLTSEKDKGTEVIVLLPLA